MRRTLAGYGIAVVIVLAALNDITWLVGKPWLHDLNVFSAGWGHSRAWSCSVATERAALVIDQLAAEFQC